MKMNTTDGDKFMQFMYGIDGTRWIVSGCLRFSIMIHTTCAKRPNHEYSLGEFLLGSSACSSFIAKFSRTQFDLNRCGFHLPLQLYTFWREFISKMYVNYCGIYFRKVFDAWQNLIVYESRRVADFGMIKFLYEKWEWNLEKKYYEC